MKDRKIIIDTNIWISIFWRKRSADFLRFTRERELQIYSDNNLKGELAEVINRKKFSKMFSAPEIELAIRLFDLVTINFKTQQKFSGSPDPKEDYLFDLAEQSGAKILVTGDKKLLDFNFPNLEIIPMNQFFDKF